MSEVRTRLALPPGLKAEGIHRLFLTGGVKFCAVKIIKKMKTDIVAREG